MGRDDVLVVEAAEIAVALIVADDEEKIRPRAGGLARRSGGGCERETKKKQGAGQGESHKEDLPFECHQPGARSFQGEGVQKVRKRFGRRIVDAVLSFGF